MFVCEIAFIFSFLSHQRSVDTLIEEATEVLSWNIVQPKTCIIKKKMIRLNVNKTANSLPFTALNKSQNPIFFLKRLRPLTLLPVYYNISWFRTCISTK